MKSAIDLLKAHRDRCVKNSLQAAARNRKKEWEKWCNKANDAVDALSKLFNDKSVSPAR